MEIIPVLDVMNGRAVSGKSGEREKYRELKTIFASSSDQLKIARNLPYEKLYVADLDGLMRGKPDIKLLKKLSEIKKLLIDAGIRNYSDVERIAKLNAEIIVATETLQNLETLKEALKKFEKRIIVSIDIKNEKVLSQILPSSPLETFEILRKLGAKRFIFLDISSVGTLRGFKFDFIKNCDEEIFVGGGIRKEDLKKLEKMGVSGALVGTALHNGLI
ncbi:MAG: HisA/HisF family protein [Euryarchaeota archaeon]|nr:HisA/HisF family protein [Euryarchaeota archaeon]